MSAAYATRALRRIALLAGFAMFTSAPLGATEPCAWFADHDAIVRLDLASNRIAASARLRDPDALVMNAADCGVWAVDGKRRAILRFDASGVLLQSIDVRGLVRRVDEAQLLQLDPYDSTLWFSDGQRIAQLDATGTLLASFSAPRALRQLAIAIDGKLWALGKKDELWRFARDGTLESATDLSDLIEHPRKLILDGLGGRIWLAAKRGLVALDAADPTHAQASVVLPRKIDALALDPQSGELWVAYQGTLLNVSREGTLLEEIALRPARLPTPERLAFDPVTRTLLAGSDKRIVRYDLQGNALLVLPAREADEALAVPAFELEPRITLVRPPENALSNDPRPSFVLKLEALCNGESCDRLLLGAPVVNATLSGTVSAQPLAPFAYDAASGEASHQVSTALPDGVYSFSAQVKDRFGHASNTLTNRFTIDTVAPRVTSLTPPDGAVFTSPAITIDGTVDDAQASIALTGQGVQTGGGFAFPVILVPGANTFVLSAIDRAGNASVTTLRYTYNPLSIAIAAPPPGAVIHDDLTTVSGALSGPPGTIVMVNGQAAQVAGNAFTAPNVVLVPGANVLTVTATAGPLTVTQTVQVTSTNTGPSEATWALPVQTAGGYDLYAKWVNDPANATNAVYTVQHAGGSAAVAVNQRQGGGDWALLGRFSLAPNQNHKVTLTDRANGQVIADAVKMVARDLPTVEEVFFVQADHLGTPRTLTDMQQRVVWRWEQGEPFGNSLPDENPSGLGEVAFHLRFAGQYYDAETKLAYNYFRDYDPALGRYVQSDPIGLRGGLNTYTYVEGHPLNHSDPYGLDRTIWRGGPGRWGFIDGPRNGNWCGGDWSGGQAPSLRGGKDGAANPLDSLDRCCMVHDRCYSKCENLEKSLRKACLIQCDRDLVRCLKNLDDDCTKWPEQPRAGTEGDSQLFRDDAVRYFEVEIKKWERQAGRRP